MNTMTSTATMLAIATDRWEIMGGWIARGNPARPTGRFCVTRSNDSSPENEAAPDPTPQNRAAQQRPLGVYVHFPWCLKKCPYCDFLSAAIQPSDIPHRAY